MSLIEKLDKECECIEVLYQQYIQNRSKYQVFIFFEGKDDFKYYNVRVQPFVVNKKHKHYNCEGKNNVISLHEMIETQTQKDENEKLLYFVDRDFDKNNGISSDIYITPVYSIENFYISDKALENIITGEMCFSGELHGDDKIDYEFALNYLKESRDKIIDSIIYSNAWYYLQKRKNNYDVDYPKLHEIKEYKNIKDINCCEQLKRLVPNAIEVDEFEINKVIDYLRSNPVKYIRGKYFEHAMPVYFNHVFQDSSKKKREFFIKKRKVSLSIGSENMISILSQYAETPPCLIEYLKLKLA